MNDLPALTEVPQRLDRADFFEMTGLQERETLDFKRALDKGDQKHVAAMSMTNGGWLVVGVDDDGSLVGWDLTQPRRDLVRHQISESVNVDVSVREIRVDEIAITIVAVPEVRDRIVTTSDGRLLRRRGSASVPLRGEDLARFVRERSTTSAEETEILFDAERLSWRAVQDVLDAADRAFEREDPVRALIDLGVAERRPGDPRGTVLRLAGLLAFGSDPTTEVPGARVEFVRRSGRGGVDAPGVRRESFIGPIIDVADATVDAVMGELPSFETVVGRRRVRIPLIPEAVLREAILNGLTHRDYGLENATVDVTMTDETVSVQSPGPLPGHVTVDNIRDEHYSRNPRLMTVLKAALVVEEFGDGVDRMFDQMAERRCPSPSTRRHRAA